MTLHALDPRALALAVLVAHVLAFLLLGVARSLIQLGLQGEFGWRHSLSRPELLVSGLFLAAFVGLVGGPLAVAFLGSHPLAPTPVALQLACAALYALSLLACFAVQFQMGRAWRIGVRHEERTALVRDGAFRWVRNPIFSLMVLLYAALAVALPTPATLAGLLCLALAVRVQVVNVEEPHLRAQLGARYEAYLARTPRFLPGLR